jgi:hypothetical protein
MTGLRGRLGKLEARRREADDVEAVGFFEADLDAGLWVDMHHGRTRPMAPEEIDEARQASAAGGACMFLGPLPDRSKKIIYGVRLADI